MEPSFRSRNIRHQVITLLQQSGPLSRAELARRIGIARSTITGAVGALIHEGMIEEMETVPVTGRGRPAVTIALAQGTGAAIGIDFGFRHVRGVIADLQHNILAIEERELGADYEFDSGIEAAFDIIGALSHRETTMAGRLLGVGIGLPCPTSNDGVTTRSAMIPKWSGRNIPKLFSERLPLPFVVEMNRGLPHAGNLYGALPRAPRISSISSCIPAWEGQWLPEVDSSAARMAALANSGISASIHRARSVAAATAVAWKFMLEFRPCWPRRGLSIRTSPFPAYGPL